MKALKAQPQRKAPRKSRARAPEAEPIIGEYVREHKYFLAVRLSAVQGVSSFLVSPLAFTYTGRSPCVPLRLTRIATTVCLDALSAEVNTALDQMLKQHEPWPMTVVAMDGAIVRMNAAAPKVFGAFFVDPSALPDPPDMISMVFDPRLMRPFVVDWPTQARAMVSRLHRERLERSGDERIEWALERALSFPDVPREWRTPDFSREATPSMTVRLQRGDLRVGFLVTVTTFSAPQQVTLEELRIEAAFPVDDETRAVCVRLTS